MATPHSPRILVVEDEKDIREITEAFLVLHGYDVTTAANGKEALEDLLKNHYDLVITDLHMPLMGGRELLENIAHMTSSPVTIILTGGVVKESDVSTSPFAYLRKPFSQEKLIQVVQEGLKHTKARNYRESSMK